MFGGSKRFQPTSMSTHPTVHIPKDSSIPPSCRRKAAERLVVGASLNLLAQKWWHPLECWEQRRKVARELMSPGTLPICIGVGNCQQQASHERSQRRIPDSWPPIPGFPDTKTAQAITVKVWRSARISEHQARRYPKRSRRTFVMATDCVDSWKPALWWLRSVGKLSVKWSGENPTVWNMCSKISTPVAQKYFGRHCLFMLSQALLGATLLRCRHHLHTIDCENCGGLNV